MTRTEYRIIGRFAKDEKPHVVDWNPKWTERDAERRLRELQIREERAKQRGEHNDGLISTPYYSEYELVDLRVQSREVTEWS